MRVEHAEVPWDNLLPEIETHHVTSPESLVSSVHCLYHENTPGLDLSADLNAQKTIASAIGSDLRVPEASLGIPDLQPSEVYFWGLLEGFGADVWSTPDVGPAVTAATIHSWPLHVL